MSRSVVHPHESQGAGPGPQDGPKPEAIRLQLRDILASPAFHGSKRCQQFLEYVCEKALTEGVDAPKERTVAVEVFGRNPESDLSDDTIVRVGAREVRKRLAQYYVTPEGETAEIRIDLPPGSYAPEFRYHTLHEARPTLPAARRHKTRWRLAIILAAGFVLAAAIAGLAIAKRVAAGPSQEAFTRFWEPVFQAPGPLLVAVAHPIVYHPSSRAMKLSEESQPAQEIPTQRVIQVQPDQLDGSDLVPVFNQYVGFGDLVAATDVAAMLARRTKDVRVRMASNVEFADLRNSPALLIGAVTNRWTMEFQQAWRFQFARMPDLKIVIADTSAEHRHWSIPAKQDGSAPEDYILLCRIRNSVTGGILVVAAGLKQFGTEAAGQLLASPEQLAPILQKLPAGWEGKNLQIVLHARVIGNTPAQPELVAWHVW